MDYFLLHLKFSPDPTKVSPAGKDSTHIPQGRGCDSRCRYEDINDG